MNSHKTWTEEDFIEAVKTSYSISDVTRKLNLQPKGGNFATVKKYIAKLGLDKSHFTGQGHLKGKTHNYAKVTPLEEVLVNGRHTATNSLKIRLIKCGMLENKCNICGIDTWQNAPLVLHMDHTNGDNIDNRLENLRLLCPNCHSQTKTYCGRNKKLKNTNSKTKSLKQRLIYQKFFCKECNKQIEKGRKVCKKCYSANMEKHRVYTPKTKIDWADDQTLINDVKQFGFSAVAKKLGVSDNAIRKRLQRRGHKI